MKYVVKHIKDENIEYKRKKNLKQDNMFLKYYSDIDYIHCVFTIDEATHFESRDRAKRMINRFKHPEFWEIVVIKDVKKKER